MPTTMNQQPILFTASMVRAILADRKRQTRRIWTLPSWAEWDENAGGEVKGMLIPKDPTSRGWYSVDEVACPFGKPKDRLWVRETFFAFGRWETRYSAKKGRDEWHFIDMTQECDRAYQYAADNPDVPLARARGALPGWWKRPAIFMPRGASRITLEITNVRVERLGDISHDDAEAEGVGLRRVSESDYRWIDYTDKDGSRTVGDPRQSFWSLWKSLNGDDALETNPWVWVIGFQRICTGNVEGTENESN